MIAPKWGRTSQGVCLSRKKKKGTEGEEGVRETQGEEIERKSE